MSVTEYKVVKSPIHSIEDAMSAAIAEGYQPYGPGLLSSAGGFIYQPVVKGTPDGGGGGPVTIVVNDLSDATDVGKAVLLSEDAESARSEIGAGTSSLELGDEADEAAPGNHSHDVASSTDAGFISASDQDKLDSIEEGATANDSDANLLSRNNHTGTQDIDTINGLEQALSDITDRLSALEEPPTEA